MGNMRLANMGMIEGGSAAAASMSEADLAKRIKAQQEKRSLLKNPNNAVSDRRLCVRNIPVSKTEKELKADILQGVFGKNLRRKIIKQVKVVVDDIRMDAQGNPRSRGYGFVQFVHHHDAVKALETLNNNPKYYSDKKRLIVEFAIESTSALNRHKLSVRSSKSNHLFSSAVANAGNRKRRRYDDEANGGNDNEPEWRKRQRKLYNKDGDNARSNHGAARKARARQEKVDDAIASIPAHGENPKGRKKGGKKETRKTKKARKKTNTKDFVDEYRSLLQQKSGAGSSGGGGGGGGGGRDGQDSKKLSKRWFE